MDGLARAEISGSIAGNTATASGPLNRINTINGDFDDATGVSVVQQNNGDNNATNSTVSVSGNGGLAALSFLP